MDSHVLYSMLTAMLIDKTLLYNNIVQTARHPLCNSETSPDDTIESSLDCDIDEDDNVPTESFADTIEEEVNDPFENPFANDIFDAPNTRNSGAVFHETDTVFADHFDGAFLHAEKLSIRLLSILRHIGAPNYVDGEIMDIVDKALQH
jgi:hypothetical protein